MPFIIIIEQCCLSDQNLYALGDNTHKTLHAPECINMLIPHLTPDEIAVQAYLKIR